MKRQQEKSTTRTEIQTMNITVVKEPVEIQENSNITEQMEVGSDVNSKLPDVRCKDGEANVNRGQCTIVHTEVRRCKQGGASVNRDDNLVHSALVSAVEHNQCDCTEMLVEAGADVNARKSLVLVEAARTGHDKCLEILLNKATMKVEIDACDANKPQSADVGRREGSSHLR